MSHKLYLSHLVASGAIARRNLDVTASAWVFNILNICLRRAFVVTERKRASGAIDAASGCAGETSAQRSSPRPKCSGSAAIMLCTEKYTLYAGVTFRHKCIQHLDSYLIGHRFGHIRFRR